MAQSAVAAAEQRCFATPQLAEPEEQEQLELAEPQLLPCSSAAPQQDAEPEPVAAPSAAQPPVQSSADEEGWQTVKPKRRGRPPGSRNKPKIVAVAPTPEVIEEEEEAPEPPEPPTVPTRARRRPVVEQQQQQPVFYTPNIFERRDLGSILSEHLLQVERQKRLSQQEMYAQLVRGVL